MSEVENYIYQFEGNQKEVIMYFHNLLTNDFNLSSKIRFKIPFYDIKSWICYLNPLKNGKIELAFIRGNVLSNHQGLLNSKGRKQVYGIEFAKISDIPITEVNEIINEAIILDSIEPYKSKRKK